MRSARWIDDIVWQCGRYGFVVDVDIEVGTNLRYRDVVCFEIDLVSGIEGTDADGKLCDGLC